MDKDRKYVILTQGHTHPTPAKLAAALLRYQPHQVVALIDSGRAGNDTFALMQTGKGIPIVATLQDSLDLHPNALVLGITPAGGQIPPEWKTIIREAIQAGLDIYSGMHTFLNDDPEIKSQARAAGVTLYDLRRPPEIMNVNQCRAATVHAFRVHTVGSDCNCGKKVATLEIHKALQSRGYDSEFIATGQSGMLVSGKGVVLDRVPGDFIAGVADQLAWENRHHEFLLIEGQGALTHPLYSGVTLGMLHGFAPQALILCHQPDRAIMRGSVLTPVPPLLTLIELYTKITVPVFPCKIVGIALNLMACSDSEARDKVLQTEFETGLPVTDVLRFGPDKLVKALLDFRQNWETQ